MAPQVDLRDQMEVPVEGEWEVEGKGISGQETLKPSWKLLQA